MAAIVIMHVEHALQTAPDLFAERSICEPGISIAWEGTRRGPRNSRSGRGSHERSDVEVTCLSHPLWGAGHSLELRATDEFIHHVESQQT